MNPLDRLEPLIAPARRLVAAGAGWWLLAALLPLLGWGLWRLRRHLPRRTIATRGEAPLDPLREAALAELAALAKPYGRASAGPGCKPSTACSSGSAGRAGQIAAATPSAAAPGWRSSTTVARPPA